MEHSSNWAARAAGSGEISGFGLFPEPLMRHLGLPSRSGKPSETPSSETASDAVFDQRLPDVPPTLFLAGRTSSGPGLTPAEWDSISSRKPSRNSLPRFNGN